MRWGSTSSKSLRAADRFRSPACRSAAFRPLECDSLFDDRYLHEVRIRKPPTAGFTLIELMVVIGIMGIILMIAIPGVYRTLHPNPLQKAVDDLSEACKAARELAVLGSRTTMLSIDLKSKTFSVQTAAEQPRKQATSPDEFAIDSPPRMETSRTASGYRFSEKVLIEGVGINGLDY